LGPLAWASRIGVDHTLRVLDNLQRSYGEPRYRPSLLLRRSSAQGGRIHD
jgi:3-hydroxybutyryl-CoA dehydrogenase